MSERASKSLNNIAMIVGILIGVGGAVQAALLLPYRVDANEKAIHAIRIKMETDHEILVRIDQTLKDLKENQTKGNRP